ncbi:hypothetical protein [Williamsia sp. 1135]|uniref:hypothetical protein n=1 Tax=Williamsia sp. 1135 TaxID=1889262 RepID=UPI001F0AE084|nr:hypothetical protein [Williamsia sp. 1135]
MVVELLEYLVGAFGAAGGLTDLREDVLHVADGVGAVGSERGEHGDPAGLELTDDLVVGAMPRR